MPSSARAGRPNDYSIISATSVAPANLLIFILNLKSKFDGSLNSLDYHNAPADACRRPRVSPPREDARLADILC